ncbi:MAG: hypothetical protein PVG04_06600 [Anaerolineales bacterium]|jgi:hypothetical protein
MKNPSQRRSVLLFILTMALSQVMCNAPSPIKALAVKSPDQDIDLSELNSGVFEVTKFDVLTQQLAECPTDFNLPEGSGVTFETVEEGLFVINEEGRTYYPQTGPGKYCRLSYEGTPKRERITCIENLSETGFEVNVQVQFELEHDPDDDYVYLECYQATYALENTLQDFIDEFADEEAVVEGETSADTNPLNQSDFDPAQCIPGPDEYVYETVNITDRSNDVIHKCNADGVLTNTGNQDLTVTAYRVHNYGGHNYEKWVYNRAVQVGESNEITEFYRCTGGECGDGAWFYFTHLALVKDTPECQQYFRSEEEPPEELRISIPNPCKW